nr:VCBS repeat-containing protein [Thermoflexales bacterium]
MNQHRLFRIVRSLAVLALLLSSLPISSTAFSQAPIETPASPTLLEGGIRLPPPPDQPEVEAPVAPPVAAPSVDQSSEPPAAPAPFSTQAPNACGADPKKLSFGQDLELLLGPLGNTTSTRIDQPPAWTGTAAVNVTGVLTQSVTGCAANPLPEQVYFYEDANYSGGCYILGPGQFKDGSSMGVHNDHLSSVKIGSNVKVTIYEDTNFSGSSETFAVNVPAMSGTSIHNDHASSAKVWLLPTAYGNIAAAPAGIDRAMTLYKTAPITGELAMQAWDAVTGWSINWTRMGFPTGSTSTDGNPALISRGTDWLIFARYGGKIAYRVQNVGIWGAWAEVLGISAAASDPAVVSMDPNHVNLFYKNASGTVYFTQWEAGRGWREAPKSLGKPSTTVSIASELSAIARDENHVAVFGVGSDNKLYVKEWSTDRLLDWSDTTWVELASNVNTTVKPAVVSRYTGQFGVAVLTTSSATGGYTSIYREWTAAQAKDYPSTTPVGWKTAVTLAGGLTSIGLAATAVDELFAHGVDSSGTAYSKQWTEAGGWGAWVSQGTGWEAGQVIATAVSRPRDLMLIGRATGNRVQAKRYTNQDRALTQSTLANPQTGGLRRQVVATVQGQTYWFSSYLDGTNRWVLEARSTSNWATAYTRVITAAHGTNTSVTDNVALAVGDLDQDGDDEVIVATKSSNNSQYQVSINKLVLTGSTIGITPLAWTSQAISTSVSDVQVAVGDLDGDGAEHEFVVAVRLSSTNQVFFRTYQFAANAITTLTDDRYVTIGYAGWDLEVAIGRLGAQSAAPAEEQIIFMSSGCFVAGIRSCGSQLAIWRVFYQTPADDEASWQAVPVYEAPVNKSLLTQAEGAYSSALATGDVDSDGWEEIVRTYGNHFSTLNVTQDVTGTVNATTGAIAPVGASDTNRSVTVGDLDGDGRPEVVYNGGALGGTRIFKQMLPDSASLNVVGVIALSGVPLLADLDGDSAVATWESCNVFADYRVISVANAEPMWYQNGAPVTGQVSAGGMGNYSGATTSAEDAWEVSLGGSVSVGFEHEFQAPILALKLGEVRASVTQEFMGSFGRKTERSTTVTEGEGGLYGGNSLGFGSVCYTATSYTCSKYTVARPGSTYTTTAMTCRPDSTVGVGTHTCNPLEDWYGSLRSAAGTSWVPVGHHTTNPKALSYDVSKYPVSVAPPLSDTYQLWWVKKDPINIVSTSKPENPA